MHIHCLTASANSIKNWHCPGLLIIFCFMGLMTYGQTGGNQPATISSVQKTAFIDHFRLRSGYHALQQARDSVRREWQLLVKQENKTVTDKKEWHKKITTALHQYELKIIEAIGKVVAKDGYTDVKPIAKDSSGKKGIDITDMVLEKLNTKN